MYMEVVSGLEVLDVEFGEQGCALISFAESYSKLRLVFIKTMFCNIWNRRLFQLFHLLSASLFGGCGDYHKPLQTVSSSKVNIATEVETKYSHG